MFRLLPGSCAPGSAETKTAGPREMEPGLWGGDAPDTSEGHAITPPTPAGPVGDNTLDKHETAAGTGDVYRVPESPA